VLLAPVLERPVPEAYCSQPSNGEITANSVPRLSHVSSLSGHGNLRIYIRHVLCRIEYNVTGGIIPMGSASYS